MAGDSTVTTGNFGSQLLQRLGLPNTPAYQGIIHAWLHAESGSPTSGNPGWKYNNPLNTRCYDWDTAKIGCWTTKDGGRFAIYPDLGTALDSYTGHGFLGAANYASIRNAKSPAQLASAITSSNWDAGHYASYTFDKQKGILALALQNGYVGYTSLGGIVAGAGNPIQTAVSNTASTASALGGVPGAIVNFFGGIVENAVLNMLAMALGFIFVIIGLWMFLKNQDNPTDAIRDMANAGLDLGLAAAAPEYAGAAGGAKGLGRKVGQRRASKASARGSGAGIRVEDAMRDSAPAGESPETPRVPVPRGYYARRMRDVKVEVIVPERKRLGSGMKLVGPGAIKLGPPKG